VNKALTRQHQGLVFTGQGKMVYPAFVQRLRIDIRPPFMVLSSLRDPATIMWSDNMRAGSA
jgi:hypothetical protein